MIDHEEGLLSLIVLKSHLLNLDSALNMTLLDFFEFLKGHKTSINLFIEFNDVFFFFSIKFFEFYIF